MKIVLFMVLTTVLLAGCHGSAQRSDPVVPATSSAPISVAVNSPSAERWSSLEKHMRDQGYLVQKYDPHLGNLITDIQGNPIGETVFAFFPASMSDEEITASRIHGVIYYLNLPAKVEMRTITFRNDQLAEAHGKNLLNVFATYRWKDSPTTPRTVP